MTPALGRIIERLARLVRLTPKDPKMPPAHAVPAAFGVVMLAASVAFAGVTGNSRLARPAPAASRKVASGAAVPALPTARTVPAPGPDSAPSGGKKPTPRKEEAQPSAKPRPPVQRAKPQTPESEMLGFYVNWDPESYSSLERNIDALTVLSPEWLHLGNDGVVHWDDFAAQKRAIALVKAKRPGLPITPIVNNFDMRTQSWNPEQVAAMLHDRSQRERIADNIVRTIEGAGFQGVNIDFEALPNSSRGDLTAFMRTLYAKAHAKGLTVSEDVAIDSATFDVRALAGATDYLVPMMYDEHYKGGDPGPVASQGWFAGDLRRMTRLVPASKIVVAMGTYGIDWAQPGAGRSVTFTKAMAQARSARVPLTLDAGSLNPVIGYPGHRTWMLDAASLFNQVSAAQRLGVRGYAIWKLGGEDPAAWRVLRNRDGLNADVAKSLSAPNRAVNYDPKQNLITGERLTP